MRKPRLSLVTTALREGDTVLLGKPGLHRMPMLVPAITPIRPKSPQRRETSWRDLVRRLAKKLAKKPAKR